MTDDFPARLAAFRPGSMLAGYELEAQIGSGGMAVVFRARDTRLDRPVALKILAPALASDHAFRQRFIAESRLAARVDDPHVIPVYEADEASGVLFITMRYVQGGDLRRLLDREGTLPPERAMEIISPVASALDAAHAEGLVHRDVKPGNILVDQRAGRPDHVYLSDFGVAKATMAPVPLTVPGIIIGTPEYSAPEQIEGHAVDGRADQYALACLAYRLLAGEAPFESTDAIAVMLAHVHEPPPSLTARRPDLPAAADRVLATALAKDPDQRHETCGDFAEALRGALGVASYSGRMPAVRPLLPAPASDIAPTVADAPPTGPLEALRPMTAPAPAAPRWEAAPPGPALSSSSHPAPPPAGQDERYRAWLGSVREAAAPPAGPTPAGPTPAGPAAAGPSPTAPSPAGPPPAGPSPAGPPPAGPWPGPPSAAPWPAGPSPAPARRRRRRAKTAVQVGVPSAVLAVAVAVILLAVDAHRGGQAGGVGDAAVAPVCQGAFPGYPGQRGAVTVNSAVAAGAIRLAVGDADGHPAIWRCGTAGHWQLLPASTAATLRGPGTLTSIANGPHGWIAAGMSGTGTSTAGTSTAGTGTGTHPLAVTSADGVTWHPVDTAAAFTGPGSCVAAVAAGPNGYASVGKHVSGPRVFAAMWSSTDLKHWAQGDNDRGGRLDGRKQPSTVNAIARTPAGFVAVGTHGTAGTIWTSPDGRAWTIVPGNQVPSGALLLAASNGNHVVAAGYATTGGGTVPVTVTSTDGGLHWNPPVILGQSGGSPGSPSRGSSGAQGGNQGTVTALSAAGSGFTVQGQLGPAGAGRTVTWHSANGAAWSKPAQAAAARQVTALSATATTATAATGQCTAP